MVVAIGDGSQQNKDDKQQRDDKMHAVHDDKGKGSATNSHQAGDLALCQKAPEAVSLSRHEGDATDECSHEVLAKQPLAFDSHPAACSFQIPTAEDEQPGTHAEGRGKHEPVADSMKVAVGDQGPGNDGRQAQHQERQAKEHRCESAGLFEKSSPPRTPQVRVVVVIYKWSHDLSRQSLVLFVVCGDVFAVIIVIGNVSDLLCEIAQRNQSF